MKRLIYIFVLLLAGRALGQVAATNLTTGTGNSATSYTTASIAPTTNHLILLAVRNQKTSGNGADVVNSVTGNGLTWVLVDTVTFGGPLGTGRAQRLSLFRALGTASSGSVVIDFNSVAQTSCNWEISDWSGILTTGTNGSGAIVQDATGFTAAAVASPVGVTLGTFSNVSNGTYGAWGLGNPGAAATAGTSMTILGQQTTNASMGAEWAATNVTTVQATYSSTNSQGFIAAEIAAGAAGPAVSLSPSSAPFGSTQAGVTSSPIVITLTNTGAATLNISSIALTTGTQFAIGTNTCGATVAASGTCTISLTFTPTSSGAKSDSLNVTDDAGGSPQSVSLTGTGTSGATSGGVGFKGIAFSLNITFGPGVTGAPPLACGPTSLFACSTHSTAVATVPTQPNMGAATGVNTTGYVYSSPSDFYYPSSGVGNCITRITDANSVGNHSFITTWTSGGNDMMWGTDRTYGAIQDIVAGRVYYISVSYDSNGCMQINNPVLSAFSPGGTSGGFSFSRVTRNIAYHILGNSGTGTVLNQETLTGTTTPSISNTTAIFDYKNCPGVPNVATTGGNGQLNVSSDDETYVTSLNFSSISGQDHAHWVLSWKRSTNQCASYYTGDVLSTENPANGNIWAYCTGNCSQSGTNPAPLALNTTCAQPGYGIHNTQATHDGLYAEPSGMCNNTVNSQTFWRIGANDLFTCNNSLYQCGGHTSATYSGTFEATAQANWRSLASPTTFTNFFAVNLLDWHGSANWTGALADTNPWMVSTTEDTVLQICTSSPYCYETMAIRQDGVVARFMPNYFVFTTGSLGPISDMTPDGYCMVVATNWNNSLGTDSSGNPRNDLFAVCNLQ